MNIPPPYENAILTALVACCQQQDCFIPTEILALIVHWTIFLKGFEMYDSPSKKYERCVIL